jgi:membrane protease subunit HflK
MPSDVEDLVRQGQDRFKQIMPRGVPRGVILLAVLALAGLAAWTAFFTVPSDSVAVVQRFGRYLKDVPPGLQFKLPLGIDAATIVPLKRQLKQAFGFTTPRRPRSVPGLSCSRRNAGNADGDR